MKKSTKRAASFMLAAGMSFTTVFANTSFVSPANSSLARLIDTLSSDSASDGTTSDGGITTDPSDKPSDGGNQGGSTGDSGSSDDNTTGGGIDTPDENKVVYSLETVATDENSALTYIDGKSADTVARVTTINTASEPNFIQGATNPQGLNAAGDSKSPSTVKAVGEEFTYNFGAAVKYVAKDNGKLALKFKAASKAYVVIEQKDNKGTAIKIDTAIPETIEFDVKAGYEYYVVAGGSKVSLVAGSTFEKATTPDTPSTPDTPDTPADSVVTVPAEDIIDNKQEEISVPGGSLSEDKTYVIVPAAQITINVNINELKKGDACTISKDSAAVKYVAKVAGKLVLKLKDLGIMTLADETKGYVVIEQGDNDTEGKFVKFVDENATEIDVDAEAGKTYYIAGYNTPMNVAEVEVPVEKNDDNQNVQISASVNGETDEVSAVAGEEVPVDINLNNVTAFDALQLNIKFDNKVLEVVRFEKSENTPKGINDIIKELNAAVDTMNENGLVTNPITISFEDYQEAINENGTLFRVIFKVKDGVKNATAELDMSSSSMTNNNEAVKVDFKGITIKVGEGSDSKPENPPENPSENVTEESSESTSEDKTETTTKKHTSSGGGGGHSSSNAAKKNNSSATTTVVKGQTGSTNTTTGTTGSKNNATKTSVGEFKTPSGIIINPPALRGADGNIVAGSKLNSSSLVAGSGFGDISGRAWAVAAINKLASLGIINGVGNNNFAPDATSKRGDFMVMLTKVLGITGTPKSSFADVESGKYYANAINLAHDLGLANGVGDNKFNPEAPISRQDMMVLVANTLKALGTDITADLSVLNKYTDASSIPTYAQPSVAYLISAGFVNGTSATTIAGNENMTRAQMAVLMSKLYDSVADTAAEAVSAEEAAAEIEAAEAKEAEETAVDTEEVSAEEKDVTTSEETEETETTK